MSRRVTRRAAVRAFEPIPAAALACVSGGIFSPRTTLDPVLLEGIKQLSAAVVSVGQSMAAAKQQSSGQMMQLMQQVMQSRGGR